MITTFQQKTLLPFVTLFVTFTLAACTAPKKKSNSIDPPQPQPPTNNPSPQSDDLNATKIENDAIEASRTRFKSGAWNQDNMTATLQKIQTYAYTFTDTHITLVTNCSFFSDGTSKFVTTTAPYTLTSKAIIITAAASDEVVYGAMKCVAKLDAAHWPYQFEDKNLVLSIDGKNLVWKQVSPSATNQ